MPHDWEFLHDQFDSTARMGEGAVWKCQNCGHQMRVPGGTRSRPPSKDVRIMVTLDDGAVTRVTCEEKIALAIQES